MSESKEARTKRPSAKNGVRHTALAAGEEIEAMAQEAPVLIPPPAAPTSLPPPHRAARTTEDMLLGYRRTVATICEAQRAALSGFKALALEMSGIAGAQMTAAGNHVAALAGARNVADAVEIQLGFARRSLDTMVAGGSRLGEIGARLVSDASRPIVAPFAGTHQGD